jgi:hypothetical protein
LLGDQVLIGYIAAASRLGQWPAHLLASVRRMWLDRRSLNCASHWTRVRAIMCSLIISSVVLFIFAHCRFHELASWPVQASRGSAERELNLLSKTPDYESHRIFSDRVCKLAVALGICRQGVRKCTLSVYDAMSALHLLYSTLRHHCHITSNRPSSNLAPLLLCLRTLTSHTSTLVDRARPFRGDHFQWMH